MPAIQILLEVWYQISYNYHTSGSKDLWPKLKTLRGNKTWNEMAIQKMKMMIFPNNESCCPDNWQGGNTTLPEIIETCSRNLLQSPQNTLQLWSGWALVKLSVWMPCRGATYSNNTLWTGHISTNTAWQSKCQSTAISVILDQYNWESDVKEKVRWGPEFDFITDPNSWQFWENPSRKSGRIWT